MACNSIEISVRGKWVRVPALSVNDKNVIVTGRWIKMAYVHDEVWQENGVENPALYINELKERAEYLKADIFTFAQRMPDTKPRYHYPMEWDNVAAINLNDPEAWWNGLSQVTRKNVRRAGRRGVVVRITDLNDDLIRGIVEINNESMLRQEKLSVHYGKDFNTVKKDFSAFLDRSEFFGAYSGDELIGLLRIVYLGKLATVLEIISKASHFDKRPTNALIAKAVEFCAKKGTTHLIYGKYSYGKKRKSSLVDFKRRNGFHEVLIPRYYVPLTLKGRICFALKLHRDLIEILPERSIYLLLGLRSLWNKLRLRTTPV